MRYCTPEGIRKQVRQVERWLKAAEQDRDPAVRFLHATYAVGNLDILRQVATDQEIAAAVPGTNPLALLARASGIQDEAAAAIRRRGPVEGWEL